MDENKNYRKFGLTNLSVNNWVSIVILAVVIMVAGFLSYTNMPKESSPEVVFPVIYVGTVYPGNSEVDIENLITRPIEKQAKSITGIKKMTSTSIQDYSTVIIEFDTDVEIDKALQDVKDKVDLAKQDLPADLDQDPNVFDINFSEFPIVTLNLSGEFSADDLRDYAEDLQETIESLPEISEVDIKGAKEREVKVNIDLNAMTSRQVSFDDVERAIATENLTISGGNIKARNFERSVRIKGEFDKVTDLNKIIVKSEGGSPVHLGDIAEVLMSFENPTSIARADGYPVVSLDVIKKSGSNILFAVDKIKEIVADAQENDLPEELSISYFNDTSENIRDQVSNLENSIIFGVLLVVLVLLFFLGLRNALFVGIAIPLSMLMGILILGFQGYTLNIVVLFSLILALGLLVDNAIVVVENIYRYVQEGYSNMEAAKRGAGEVALPIIAATATTLAAFLPLAFWPGIMGGFMKYMPITLIAVLISSLFVALVFNPVFTSLFAKADSAKETKEEKRSALKSTLIAALVFALFGVVGIVTKIMWFRNIMFVIAALIVIYHFAMQPAAIFFQNKVLPALENMYDKFIRITLKKWVAIPLFLFTIVMTVVALGAYFSSNPKTEFFPQSDPLFVNAFIEFPNGTDIETTNKVSATYENKVVEMLKEKNYMSVVEDVLIQIGENTGDPAQPGGDPGSTPNKARLTVSFVKYQERGGIDTKDIFKDIRALFKDETQAKIVVDMNQSGPPQGKPINIEVRGDNLDELLSISDRMIAFVEGRNIGGIEELQADVAKDKPQLDFKIDRESARRFGLSTLSIASTIRTAQYGKEASKFKEGEDEYPIMIRLSDDYRNDINKLANQKVTFRDPATGRIVQVPISAVSDWDNVYTYSSVKRKDQKRVVTIFSNVLKDEGFNENEVVADIKTALEDFDMPAGYTFEFTGQQEEMAEQMAFLMGALAIAGAMILLIIVAQFNSLTAPIIVMFAFLFSLIGVFGGYVLTDQPFIIIMSMVGIISLAGVVVNNAIVLMDYTELLKKDKAEKLGVTRETRLADKWVFESIVEAGKTRLRPVLLTAITTVLGLMPLAYAWNINFITWITTGDPQIYVGGDNAAFWGPLAKTVIYGLVFATFLTLVVVPIMYWLFYKATNLLMKVTGTLKPAKG